MGRPINIIYRPRGHGKTTEMVKRCSINRNTIVCATQSRVDNIIELASTLNLEIEKPLLFSEFVKINRKMFCGRRFSIDQIDHCMRAISHNTVRYMSLDNTENDKKW